MRTRTLFLMLALMVAQAMPAQSQEDRYIEVTGTSEVEIVPDKIHYIIEIKEYYAEEFDGKSKPEQYKTKICLEQIETELRKALRQAGIGQAAIRTQEVGDYWRERGQNFLISKRLDITLTDFRQIESIVKHIDTKGVRSMHIGELENNRMQEYHRQGKTKALEAARDKACYLVETLGKRLGAVIRIVEPQETQRFGMPTVQSNVYSSDVTSFDEFRTIKKNYSMLVRFEIKD